MGNLGPDVDPLVLPLLSGYLPHPRTQPFIPQAGPSPPACPVPPSPPMHVLFPHLRTHLLLPGHEASILPPQALLRREELSPAQIQGKGNGALPLRRRYVKEWMDTFQTLLNDAH